MTTGELFNRVVRVQVEDIDVSNLHVEFDVTRHLDKEPNTASITIWNLGDINRAVLAETKAPIVQLSAGYEETKAGVIFLGNLQSGRTTHDDPDWISMLETGDGETAFQFDRINKAFSKGAKIETVLLAAAKRLKVGLGNVTKAIQGAKLVTGGTDFTNGYVASGNAANEFDVLVRSIGLTWSIQDGVIQIDTPDVPLADVSVVLTPSSGLIGSPTLGSDGVIELTALMNSDIVPGRQLEVESKVTTGRFKAEHCRYVGSNLPDSKDFYVKVEGSQL